MLKRLPLQHHCHRLHACVHWNQRDLALEQLRRLQRCRQLFRCAQVSIVSKVQQVAQRIVLGLWDRNDVEPVACQVVLKVHSLGSTVVRSVGLASPLVDHATVVILRHQH
jgi:hypothetical protein